MLVVDFHTLEAVHFLNFVDEVFLEAFLAADIQNFFRGDGAFRKLVAQMHMVVFMDDDVLVHRHQVVHQFARRRFNGDDLLAAGGVLAAEAHNAFHACNGAGVLGLAGFKQFRHAGRPPVMSFVLATLRGVLATIVPAEMVSPSFTVRLAPAGMAWWARTSRVLASRMTTCG